MSNFYHLEADLPLKKYIPNKPEIYGLKKIALVHSKAFYTINLETYVGKPPDDRCNISNCAADIVLRIVEPVQGTKRNISGDNRLTSLELAKMF